MSSPDEEYKLELSHLKLWKFENQLIRVMGSMHYMNLALQKCSFGDETLTRQISRVGFSWG